MRTIELLTESLCKIMARAAVSMLLLTTLPGGIQISMAKPVRVAGTKVELDPPADYQVEPRVKGFLKIAEGLISVNAPASTYPLLKQSYETGGLRIISRSPVRIGEYEGMLYLTSHEVDSASVIFGVPSDASRLKARVEMEAPGEPNNTSISTGTADGTPKRENPTSADKASVQKNELLAWNLIFGNDNLAVHIVAMFPATATVAAIEELKQAVLSARYVDSLPADKPVATAAFTMAEQVGGLKLAGDLPNGMVYTPTGSLKVANNDTTMFIAKGGSLAMDTTDRERHARDTLMRMSGIASSVLLTEKDILVDGLPARELEATGPHSVTRVQQYIYKVVVYGPSKQYFELAGFTDVERKDQWSKDFRQLVKTFKLKSVTPPASVNP